MFWQYNFVLCSNNSETGSTIEPIGEVQHTLIFTRAVPQLPDQWHRLPNLHHMSSWLPRNQMTTVSPIWQLGHVWKGADVFAAPLYYLNRTRLVVQLCPPFNRKQTLCIARAPCHESMNWRFLHSNWPSEHAQWYSWPTEHAQKLPKTVMAAKTIYKSSTCILICFPKEIFCFLCQR